MTNDNDARGALTGSPKTDSHEFIVTTNREHEEWFRAMFVPECEIDLKSLWAWQEQERRKRAALASLPAGDGLTPDRDAVFAEMYKRDPYWDTQGRSSAAAVRLALECSQLLAAPRQPGEMGAGVHGAGIQCNCDQPTNGVHALDCPAAPLQAFEAAYSHLDLTKQIDSWRGLVYKHSHVDAMWEAWQRAASAQRDERISFDDWYAGLSPQWKRVIDAANGGDSEAEQVQADAGAVAYIPDDALARLTPPLLVLDGVRLYRYNGVGTTALYTRPAAESDKRDALMFAIHDSLKGIANCISDPMWADHAEVSKHSLKKWHKTLHDVRAAMSREQSGKE